MAHVEVPNTKILNAFGSPWQVASRDDDGEVVWEDAEKGRALMEPATTASLIRELLLTFSHPQGPLRGVMKGNDGFHVHRLWNQVRKSECGDYLSLDQDQYRWLHSFYSRTVPVSREAKEAGVEAQTVAATLYGVSDWSVLEQLKSIDERKAIEE